MPVEVVMPALSPTMEQGKIASWTVKEGDKVEAGDVLAEIETDKALVELEAAADGEVGKLVIEAGTSDIPVNTPIAYLLRDGEALSDIETAPAPVPEKPETPFLLYQNNHQHHPSFPSLQLLRLRQTPNYPQMRK